MKSTENCSLETRIRQARHAIRKADYILIGAGAGLSAAAGLHYSGKEFEEEFRPWIQRYGITDLYSSSFYPFNTEEERWAYWARHIWFARFRPQAMPLYRKLYTVVQKKPYFVITTNVDAQFEKSGFEKEKIFATQGDYAYLQSRSGNPKKLYYNEDIVMKMLIATTDCKIPLELVPHCPDSGELMTPNLRCDETFVEDEHWHRQAEAYRQFLNKACRKQLVLFELGVGFNTPSIIRFPFEQMARDFPCTTLIRFNRDYPQPFSEKLGTFIPFTEDIDMVLSML